MNAATSARNLFLSVRGARASSMGIWPFRAPPVRTVFFCFAPNLRRGEQCCYHLLVDGDAQLEERVAGRVEFGFALVQRTILLATLAAAVVATALGHFPAQCTARVLVFGGHVAHALELFRAPVEISTVIAVRVSHNAAGRVYWCSDETPTPSSDRKSID